MGVYNVVTGEKIGERMMNDYENGALALFRSTDINRMRIRVHSSSESSDPGEFQFWGFSVFNMDNGEHPRVSDLL